MKLRSATKKPEQICSKCQMLQPIFINRRTPVKPKRKLTTQSPVFNIHIHITPKNEKINSSTSAQPVINLHFDEIAKTLGENISQITLKKIVPLDPESMNLTLGSINELDSSTNGSEKTADESENRDSDNEMSDSLEKNCLLYSEKNKLDSSNQEHSSEMGQKDVKGGNYTEITSSQSSENELHHIVRSSEILKNFSDTISGNKNDIKLKKAVVLLKDIKKNHNYNTMDTITVSSESNEDEDKFLKFLQQMPSPISSTKGSSKKPFPIVKDTSQALLSPSKRNSGVSSKIYQSDDESKKKISDLTNKCNFSEILQKLQDENLRKVIQSYAYRNRSDDSDGCDCPTEKKISRKRKSEIKESDDLKHSGFSKKRTSNFGIDSKLKNTLNGIDSAAKKKREKGYRKSRKALNFSEITIEERNQAKINLSGSTNTLKNYEVDLTQNEFDEEIIWEKVENSTENVKRSDLELNKCEVVLNKIDIAEYNNSIKKCTILKKSINGSKKQEIQARNCRSSTLKVKKNEKVKKRNKRLERSTCTTEKMREIEEFMIKLKESLRKEEQIAEEQEIEFEEKESLSNEILKEDDQVLQMKSKKKKQKSLKRKKNESEKKQDRKEKLKRQEQGEKESEILSFTSNLIPNLQVRKDKVESDCENIQMKSSFTKIAEKNRSKGKSLISGDYETCFGIKDVDLIPETPDETNFKNNSPVCLTNDEVFLSNTSEEKHIKEVEKIAEIIFNDVENEEAIGKTDTEGECCFSKLNKKKWTPKSSSSVTTADDDVATEIFELSNNEDNNSNQLYEDENEDESSATVEFRESDLEDFTSKELKKAIDSLDFMTNGNSDNAEELPEKKLSCTPKKTESLKLSIKKPSVEKKLEKNSLSKKMSVWARQPIMSDDLDDCDATGEAESDEILTTTSHDSEDSVVSSESIFKAVKKKELKKSKRYMQLTSDSDDEHLKKNGWKMKKILNNGKKKCEVIIKKVNSEVSSKSDTTMESAEFNDDTDLTSNAIELENEFDFNMFSPKISKMKFTEHFKKLKKKSCKKKCSLYLSPTKDVDEGSELETFQVQKCKLTSLTPNKTVESDVNGNISMSDFDHLFSEIQELNFGKEIDVGERQLNVEAISKADVVNDTLKVLEKVQGDNNVCLKIHESCEKKNKNSTNKNKNFNEVDEIPCSKVELLDKTLLKKKIKSTSESSQSKEMSREFDSDQEIPPIFWPEKKCERNKLNSNETPPKMVKDLGIDKVRNVSTFKKNNSEIFSKSEKSTFQRENSETNKSKEFSGVSDSWFKEKKKKDKKVRKNLNEFFNNINDVECSFNVKPVKEMQVCSGKTILGSIAVSDLNVRNMEICEKTDENLVDKTKNILSLIKITETPKKVIKTPEKLQAEVSISSGSKQNATNNDGKTGQTDVVCCTLETPKTSKKRRNFTNWVMLNFKSSSVDEKNIKLLEGNIGGNTKLDLYEQEQLKSTKEVKKKKKIESTEKVRKKKERVEAEIDREGNSPSFEAKKTFMKTIGLTEVKESEQSESVDDSGVSKPYLNSAVLDLMKSPEGRFSWSQINKACDEISEFELVCEQVSKMQQNLTPPDKCETRVNRNIISEIQFNCIKKGMIGRGFREKFKKKKSKIKKKKPDEQKEKFKGKASTKLSKKIKIEAKMQKDSKKNENLSSPDYIPLNSSGSTQFAVSPLNKIASYNNHSAMNFKQRMLFGDRVNRFKSNSTLRTLKIKHEIKKKKF